MSNVKDQCENEERPTDVFKLYYLESNIVCTCSNSANDKEVDQLIRGQRQ